MKSRRAASARPIGAKPHPRMAPECLHVSRNVVTSARHALGHQRDRAVLDAGRIGCDSRCLGPRHDSSGSQFGGHVDIGTRTARSPEACRARCPPTARVPPGGAIENVEKRRARPPASRPPQPALGAVTALMGSAEQDRIAKRARVRLAVMPQIRCPLMVDLPALALLPLVCTESVSVARVIGQMGRAALRRPSSTSAGIGNEGAARLDDGNDRGDEIIGAGEIIGHVAQHLRIGRDRAPLPHWPRAGPHRQRHDLRDRSGRPETPPDPNACATRPSARCRAPYIPSPRRTSAISTAAGTGGRVEARHRASQSATQIVSIAAWAEAHAAGAVSAGRYRDPQSRRHASDKAGASSALQAFRSVSASREWTSTRAGSTGPGNMIALRRCRRKSQRAVIGAVAHQQHELDPLSRQGQFAHMLDQRAPGALLCGTPGSVISGPSI